jgi:predicted nucleic-acid-binding Zn-ribbon protein
MKYSQAAQDQFVLYILGENYKGFFLDVGCSLPTSINNTLRLEERGWKGISIDIEDYNEQWKIRNTPFVQSDALKCDYSEIFKKYDAPSVIDYLSLDIEGDGTRFLALEKVFGSGVKFKVITIEHDSYRGYELSEKIPQRKLLKEKGYYLLCSDILNENNPYEDWWINPEFFDIEKFEHLKCNNTPYEKIRENFRL